MNYDLIISSWNTNDLNCTLILIIVAHIYRIHFLYQKQDRNDYPYPNTIMFSPLVWELSPLYVLIPADQTSCWLVFYASRFIILLI